MPYASRNEMGRPHANISDVTKHGASNELV